MKNIKYYMYCIRLLPVLVSDEGSSELNIMAGVRSEFAHCGLSLFNHVQKHFGQLRILIQVHQVGKTVVHFESHACFLIGHIQHDSTVITAPLEETVLPHAVLI